MKNGVPFNTAFGIEAGETITLAGHETFALAVIFGEFDGGVFDWDNMAWERRDD